MNTKNTDIQFSDAALRKSAEQKIAKNKKEITIPPQEIESLESAQRILAELQIHQIELEMQNDELRRAQLELKQEREKYANLYNFAPVAYFLFDENDIILDLNLKATELLNRQHNHLLRRPLTAFLTPASLNIFIEHRQRALETGEQQICELQIRTEEDYLRDVRVHTVVLEDMEEGAYRWRSVMIDITEEKKNAKALEHSHNLLLALGHGAKAVHLAATPEDVYRAVGEQLEHFGSELGIFILGEENQLHLAYTTVQAGILLRIAKKFNQSPDGLTLPVIKDGLLARVIAEKQTLYVEDMQHLKSLRQSGIAASRTFFLVKLFNVRQMIVAPLAVGDNVIGLLLVMGNKLQDIDVTAIDIFASQIAISLHKAQLTEELKQSYLREQELAETDALTGIKNRRALYQIAAQEIEIAHRYNKSLSLIMLDVDHFKKVNDTFGHLVGDKMLQHIASLVKKELRSADCLGRYGGEEFVVILPETSLEQAHQLAERLRNVVKNTPLKEGDNHVSVTISLGIIGLNPSIQTLDELLTGVDQALYVAKNNGRNKVELYI